MSKVYLLSLGCPKNQVDSEKLLKKLEDKNIFYSSDPDAADMILVNTCGFIEAAKKESVNEILKLAGLKEGKKKLLVYGCLAKRYGDELLKEIPEIDSIWGVGEDEAIVEYCSIIETPRRKSERSESFSERPYAYLKIGEGCDRTCSYCAIPAIRGPYRSFSPDDIMGEAEELIKSGTKELIIIAQDITSYGSDMKGYGLPRLLREIADIDGDFWVRLLYLYPTSVDDSLLEAIASLDKVCNYIDMPLQHSEKNVLGLMRRGGGRTYFERLIKRIREIIPDVALRTTFITGFPQETEEDFNRLLDFVRKTRFDRLGVFTYSKEEGTPAASLKGQLPLKNKRSRHDRIMETQAGISLSKNLDLVGRRFRALMEETDGDVAIARLYSQAPEIDGVVLIKDKDAIKGEFAEVRITKAYDYDLEAEPIR